MEACGNARSDPRVEQAHGAFSSKDGHGDDPERNAMTQTAAAQGVIPANT